MSTFLRRCAGLQRRGGATALLSTPRRLRQGPRTCRELVREAHRASRRDYHTFNSARSRRPGMACVAPFQIWPAVLVATVRGGPRLQVVHLQSNALDRRVQDQHRARVQSSRISRDVCLDLPRWKLQTTQNGKSQIGSGRGPDISDPVENSFAQHDVESAHHVVLQVRQLRELVKQPKVVDASLLSDRTRELCCPGSPLRANSENKTRHEKELCKIENAIFFLEAKITRPRSEIMHKSK